MVQLADKLKPGDYVILRTPLQVIRAENGIVEVMLPRGTFDIMTDVGDTANGPGTGSIEVSQSMVGQVSLPTVEEVEVHLKSGVPYR
jgi:hypothetical protein